MHFWRCSGRKWKSYSLTSLPEGRMRKWLHAPQAHEISNLSFGLFRPGILTHADLYIRSVNLRRVWPIAGIPSISWMAAFQNGFKHDPVLWLGPITQPIWKSPLAHPIPPLPHIYIYTKSKASQKRNITRMAAKKIRFNVWDENVRQWWVYSVTSLAYFSTLQQPVGQGTPEPKEISSFLMGLDVAYEALFWKLL